MLAFSESVHVFLSLQPVDMRKSIDGLTALIVDVFHESPQSGHVFVFYNKTKRKIKLVYWHKNGFMLCYKRLDKGRFKIDEKDGVLSLSAQQLQWLLAGLAFDLMQQFSELNYTNYY